MSAHYNCDGGDGDSACVFGPDFMTIEDLDDQFDVSVLDITPPSCAEGAPGYVATVSAVEKLARKPSSVQ